MEVPDVTRRESSGTEMANVDGSTDPMARVEYLDRVTRTAAYKKETYGLLEIAPGEAVLDVGCGAGDDVRAMAEIVGARGHSVGIDLSQTMVDEAKRRSEGSTLPVEFVQASAYELPFDDDTFDASRVDRVLQHLDDPVRVLREMVRVTKPGGRILAVDTDFNSMIVASDYPELEQRIWSWWEEWRAGQPGSSRCGRLLHEHFLDAGVTDLVLQIASPHSTDLEVADKMMSVIETAKRAAEAGAISDDEARLWEEHLRDRAKRGRFLLAFLGFTVHGRVPDELEA